MDITIPSRELIEIADCVSCLHTLEHIGLGRYGDQIDPEGWKEGLKSLAGLLKERGELWLSVPIGVQRVEFNAHRVFSPSTIRDEAALLGLRLEEFHFWKGQEILQSEDIDGDIVRLSRDEYSLGIFCFRMLKP